MKKITVLTLAIVALLLVNMVTLVFLFFGSSHSDRILRPDLKQRFQPKAIIIKELNLNAQQVKSYEHLIANHRATIDSLDQIIRNNKRELYQNLANNDGDTADSVLINKINHVQKQIEITHYNHFLGIKKICNSNQIDKYKLLTTQLNHLFSRPPHPHHAQ
ncbi:hypothetical protein [Flavobacterium sp.]|uniref:hypothetical protein n=1 Tax=Flavobacterium sp. TaxID=239 RepID=UPI002618FD6B|nr:hypothetical protein [Flavobacterium sp.]